jgi:putative hydrolase of the HAD superfamily
MPPSPQATLFDLDGTLFDRDASFLELVRAQYHVFRPELEGSPMEVFVARAIELDKHGYVDKSVVYREPFPTSLSQCLVVGLV